MTELATRSPHSPWITSWCHWLKPMRLIRVTFTATTEAQTSRTQTVSLADHRCPAHCEILTQHKSASDILVSEEQAGNTTMYPEPSNMPTVLPTRLVPKSHATNAA